MMQLKDFLRDQAPSLPEWGLYAMGSLSFPFERTGDDYRKSAERDTTADAVDIATLFVKVTNSIFSTSTARPNFTTQASTTSRPPAGSYAWHHIDFIRLFIALRTTQDDPIILFRSIVLKQTPHERT